MILSTIYNYDIHDLAYKPISLLSHLRERCLESAPSSEFDDNDFDHAEDPNQNELERLKGLRENIDWEVEEEVRKFICKLYPLISNWKGPLPNLRDIFQEEEIHRLLLEVVHYRGGNWELFHKSQIIKFVIGTGYNDDRFDVNYTDESGLTHFHVACMTGCDDVTEKFLELGQDPDCLALKSVDPPGFGRMQRQIGRIVVEPRRRDPNLANAEGSTPLHIVCKRHYDDALLDEFFDFIDAFELRVRIDAQNMAENYLELLTKLKIMRDKVNWKVEKERRLFLHQLYPMARNLYFYWRYFAPKKVLYHRDIFRREEIDWLLIEDAKNNSQGGSLVEFFVDTGYKDQPDVDPDGKPSPRRTTAVHHVARLDLTNENEHNEVIRALFEIYDRFDVNYVDESGLTHFHVACMYNLNHIVQKFLELGQDPNCLVIETVNPPLHLALANYNFEMTELLLRHGANPNFTNIHGETPLHIICWMYFDEIYLTELFFKANDKTNQLVQIDAQEKFGNTPLNYAVHRGNDNIAKLLLRNGANPNLANEDGLTPLHFICMSVQEDDFVEFLFKFVDDKHEQLEVDARDKKGRTPLEYAVAHLLPNTVDLLLDHGADVSNFVFPTTSDFDCEWITLYQGVSFRLRLVYGLLAIVNSLEKRGYKVDQSDVSTIMKIFIKYNGFKKLADFEERWLDDKEFVMQASSQFWVDMLSKR
ncbi:unnamed protein product [Trichogramma brassicae]|uniref:Uncharacterized protein n=1 Tax=Trichogramma brassicae TaxID=86971 RepID=A0A6H5J5Z9_9HYME|nr:unnamed protein product [Trichogramma brassicae]